MCPVSLIKPSLLASFLLSPLHSYHLCSSPTFFFLSYLKHYPFLLHQQETVVTSYFTFSLLALIAHSFNTTSCLPFMYTFFFLSCLHYPLFFPSLTLAKHTQSPRLVSLFPSSLIYTISCLSFPYTLFSLPISISHYSLLLTPAKNCSLASFHFFPPFSYLACRLLPAIWVYFFSLLSHFHYLSFFPPHTQARNSSYFPILSFLFLYTSSVLMIFPRAQRCGGTNDESQPEALYIIVSGRVKERLL